MSMSITSNDGVKRGYLPPSHYQSCSYVNHAINTDLGTVMAIARTSWKKDRTEVEGGQWMGTPHTSIAVGPNGEHPSHCNCFNCFQRQEHHTTVRMLNKRY